MRIRFATAVASLGLFVVSAKAQTADVINEINGSAGPQKPSVFSVIESAFSSQICAVGSVLKVEKEPIDVPSENPLTPDVRWKGRVVWFKVETTLMGKKNVTHLEVVFQDDAKILPADGDKYLLKVNKHAIHQYYLGSKSRRADDEIEFDGLVEEISRAAKIVKAPLAALKSEKAEDRHYAANLLIAKYRYFDGVIAPSSNENLPEEENRLILKSLAEQDWKWGGQFPARRAFYDLDLSPADGWIEPNDQKGDQDEVCKKAYLGWLNGPGKDYRIKRYVPKAK